MWSLTVGGKITGDSIREFNAQSPRTTAIVGAAILEDALEKAVASRFPTEGEIKNKLFKPVSGPLGNLDTKIKIAYAMGLISKTSFQDMTAIVEVRNRFAHRLQVDDFGHAEVCARCMGLRLVDKHFLEQGLPEADWPKEPSLKMFVPELKKKLDSPRDRYFLSVMLFHHALTMGTPRPENTKPSPPRALI